MKDQSRSAKVILLIARIWGSLILAFILFFVVAHIFGEEEADEGFRTAGELISFIAFPVSLVVGLSTAYKWEGIGGFIVIIGAIIFFALRPDLLLSFIFYLAFMPGVLYVVYWFLTKDKQG